MTDALRVLPAQDERPELEVEGVDMEFGRGRRRLRVLDSIDLVLPPSRFVSIVGPNGCGKSTLVRLIAGLAKPTRGRILQRRQEVSGPGNDRLLMFQQPMLFPWMTLRRNLLFALRAKGTPRRERQALVDRYLTLVGLADFAKRYPLQLSGGMLQRAELARALAVHPRVLLMDEPFAAVDSLSRLLLQEELARFREGSSTAFVMVTHDVREAAFLGDQVVLMSRRPGRVKRVFDLPWPTPRSPALRHSPAFAAVCEEILDGLREEIDGAEPASLRTANSIG
jgi:ABC-type nitrate/sulfonate/bicarbonate transport system ATPase subunit